MHPEKRDKGTPNGHWLVGEPTWVTELQIQQEILSQKLKWSAIRKTADINLRSPCTHAHTYLTTPINSL